MSTFEWEIKGEVTPEELRKRFEEYKNDPDHLRTMVIDYLMPYMVVEILRANADAMTKAQAIFYLGEIYGALDGLKRLTLELKSSLGPYKELAGNYEFIYGYIMRMIAETLIDFYEDFKKGWSLNHMKEALGRIVWNIEFGSFELPLRFEGELRLIRKQNLKPS